MSNEAAPIDAALIARALANDPEAMNELCARLQPELLAYTRTLMTGQAQRHVEAEDIVQKVLADLVSNPGKYLDPDDPEKLKKFLFGAVSWRIKDSVRSHRGHHGESEIGPSEREPYTAPSTGPVTGSDDRRWLREFILHLHGRPRDVVVLCGLEGHSYTSAAQVLGTTADAVRKAYQRAHETLVAEAQRRIAARERISDQTRD